jgi:NAD(P)-dependent dehydrogenase (short-subunit alcohol dehydrogenase family)
MDMTQRFLNKIAVIVGGSRGIGLSEAKAFAAEGARVVITGRDREALQAIVNETVLSVMPIEAVTEEDWDWLQNNVEAERSNEARSVLCGGVNGGQEPRDFEDGVRF